MLTEHDRPGLIVVDDNEHPIAILPGSQVLRMLIPRYVQDDPTLARVLDEDFADKMYEALADKTVHDLMPQGQGPAAGGRPRRHGAGDRGDHGGQPEPAGRGRGGAQQDRAPDRCHQRAASSSAGSCPEA